MQEEILAHQRAHYCLAIEKRRAIADAHLASFAQGGIKSYAKTYYQFLLSLKADPVEFFNNVLVTYDPRHAGLELPTEMPFVLYPRQVEFLRWLQERYKKQGQGVVAKSRTVGATWICLGFSLWLFVFSEDKLTISWSTRKLEELDRIGEMGTHFEKLRMMCRNLPKHLCRVMLPGFNEGQHATHRKLVNPKTGTTIVGHVGHGLGRGGRSRIYFLDEAAFIPKADSQWRAIIENTSTFIALSTSNGPGNRFERTVNQGSVPTFWIRHDAVPHQASQAWLEYKEDKDYKNDPEGFDREILINFYGPDSSAVIPGTWVRAAVNFEGDTTPHTFAGLDVAYKGDLTVLVICSGSTVIHIESWRGLATEDTAKKVIDILSPYGCKELYYDAIGIGEGVGASLRLLLREEESNLIATAIISSRRATEMYWEGTDAHSFDFLSNLRSEMWWNLRERFRKTHACAEAIKLGKTEPYERDACISIPDHQKLITQLSWFHRKTIMSGKIAIESKESMMDRLSLRESPDFADALVYAFASYLPIEGHATTAQYIKGLG